MFAALAKTRNIRKGKWNIGGANTSMNVRRAFYCARFCQQSSSADESKQ
jgi:hypothetical protein